MRTIVTSAAVALAVAVPLALAPAASPAAQKSTDSIASLVVRSLDGKGNNLQHSDWGQAGTQYTRVASANYADGVGRMVGGPAPRYVSNRIFNDIGQNLFSENNISQWGWAWGQFIDHDVGLRDETAAESAPMVFNQADPLEGFTNDLGQMDFSRTPAASNTGVSSPRQQINTLSSFMDASMVYGVTNTRLDWLRDGPFDRNPKNNNATLKLPGGYLPRRGNDPNAPVMDLMGPLAGTPDQAAVAGDVRANENIALTALQTLFAREHNRIVGQLPGNLPQELKFQIARRIVGAEIQRITYTEFLPTLGVNLDPYRGYNQSTNPGLSNEFATVGFRAHSMIHGEFEPTVPANFYSADQLDNLFPRSGIVVERNTDGTVTLVIPLSVAFGNPGLLQLVGEDQVLSSLAERQYKNDEQIDNALRSVLFQIPKPGTDPGACGAPVISPDCFSVVSDLGADDVQRGRDHGMPFYNQLRQAYGLPAKTSFEAITGESSSGAINPNDPSILDFTQLRDAAGNVILPGTDAAADDAIVGIRRTTLAARLKAVYGDVNTLDAFTGMVAEQHGSGSELGPLQLAIWKRQFQALRDGDRFFFVIDPALPLIQRLFPGVTSQHTLAEIVRLNTGATVAPNVFRAG